MQIDDIVCVNTVNRSIDTRKISINYTFQENKIVRIMIYIYRERERERERENIIDLTI